MTVKTESNTLGDGIKWEESNDHSRQKVTVLSGQSLALLEVVGKVTASGKVVALNPAALDGSGQQSKDGAPAMKPFWEISKKEAKACLDATTWHPSVTEYFPGGGWSSKFVTKGGMPITMSRVNLVKGFGPVLRLRKAGRLSCRKMFMPSWITAPITPGRPPGLRRASPEKAPSPMFTK